MSEKSRHFTSNDGRHRVAYEGALAMWRASHGNNPNLEDKDEFLHLVNEFTRSLSWGDG